jgi:hypothetical protein
MLSPARDNQQDPTSQHGFTLGGALNEVVFFLLEVVAVLSSSLRQGLPGKRRQLSWRPLYTVDSAQCAGLLAGNRGGMGAGGSRRARKVAEVRPEGPGQRLLGLLDQVHQMPPQLIAPLVAEEAGRIGGRDVCILLQDYDQRWKAPEPSRSASAEPRQSSASTSSGQG